ncbi:MAG: ABC transporter permease [Lentisphaerae bacterium]|nr:ABC transporter permease [Lentisphaerota bacterium]
MLGIVFGVGSVIAMLSVGEGASRDALNRIRRLGSHNIILSSVKPIDESQDSQRRRTAAYGLTYDDVRRIREGIPSVRRLAPAKLLRKPARVGRRTMEIRLAGVTPDWFDLVRRERIAGRLLTAEDEGGVKNAAVLTEHVARTLLAAGAILGRHVGVDGQFLEVVGIIRGEPERGGGLQTPDRANDVYAPLAFVRTRFGDVDMQMKAGEYSREEVELHQCIVEIDRIEHVEPAAAAIGRMLAETHKHDDTRIQVPLALLREARETKRTFNIVLGSIACISLLVGGIGIMNIMLASVTERTREIGIRRAIGATRRHIVLQFITETIVLSTIGGLLGIGLGLLIPWLITRLAGLPTVITAWSVALSLVISVGVGLVFGIYPAARAARLDPIRALRHE